MLFFVLVRVILLRSLSHTGDQKNKEYEYSFFFCSGASGENRTLIPSLENLYTNRCTTLANGVGDRN